ncbi:MAG: hypothetical protein MZV70_55880 [Desulfobacterales bacterium]|nr:hypothetical protein [Desulfobacterales bacterium]
MPWKIPILVVAAIAGCFPLSTARGSVRPSPAPSAGCTSSMLLPFVFLLYPAWKKSPQPPAERGRPPGGGLCAWRHRSTPCSTPTG